LLLNFETIYIGQFQIEYQATRTIGLFKFEKINSAFESSGAKSGRFQKAAKGFADPTIIVDDKDERRFWAHNLETDLDGFVGLAISDPHNRERI